MARRPDTGIPVKIPEFRLSRRDPGRAAEIFKLVWGSHGSSGRRHPGRDVRLRNTGIPARRSGRLATTAAVVRQSPSLKMSRA